MGEKQDIRVWGIHGQDDELFLHDNVIAIGWRKLGDLSKIDATREAFKSKYAETYPEKKKGNVANSAGMLYRFCHEVQIGDYVIFPSKSDRKINIGTIESGYIYNETASEYVQQRKVRWLKHLPRTFFSQGALYEIGSAMSFFSVKNYADEYLAALDRNFRKTSAAEDETVGAPLRILLRVQRTSY